VKVKKMKAKTRDPLAIGRAAVRVTACTAVYLVGLIGVILAASAVVTLTAESRAVFALAHGSQDPAPPPSPPSVTLSPDNLLFADQVVRWTSAAKRITVRNTGGQSLYIDSLTITGDNPNSFAIANDTCTGATVDASKACIVDVTFTPSGTGERNARVKLSDNAPDSPQRLRLKGNGINSNDVAPF
jgi:hypothetical protein